MLWTMELIQVTALVVLDLSAVSNTADHMIVLKGLKKKFGIIDDELEWT